MLLFWDRCVPFDFAHALKLCHHVTSTQKECVVRKSHNLLIWSFVNLKWLLSSEWSQTCDQCSFSPPQAAILLLSLFCLYHTIKFQPQESNGFLVLKNHAVGPKCTVNTARLCGGSRLYCWMRSSEPRLALHTQNNNGSVGSEGLHKRLLLTIVLSSPSYPLYSPSCKTGIKYVGSSINHLPFNTNPYLM